MHSRALIWSKSTCLGRYIAIAHPIVPAIVPNAFGATRIGYTTIIPTMWGRIADRIAIDRTIIIRWANVSTAISIERVPDIESMS
jgi:hypothetical protein